MTGPKKMSAKQLAANRANAQRSTGPRTPQGKARSRWNALQHGVLAKAVIPQALEPYESRQEFADLLATLQDEFAPASAIEEILVERIAVSYWRLARLLRAESGTIASQQKSYHYGLGQYARDAATQVERFMPMLLWMEEHQQDGTLTAEDIQAFRDQLIEGDDLSWDECFDEELIPAARRWLEECQRRQALPPPAPDPIRVAQEAMLPIQSALNFARYEAHLQRQLDSALASLERLQRLRAGDRVLPPLQVSVDVAAPLAGEKVGVTD